ncbi:hypothetical protein DFH06DRAFT_1185775 [Mycena polygramma]|nr:hypothetical protein DFH06DRAFT_1185775 [Mycena polygramma]
MCSPPVIANAAVYNISGKIKRINSHVIANFASMPRYTQELEMIMRSGAQRGAVIFNGGELNVGGDYESIGSTTTVNFGQVPSPDVSVSPQQTTSAGHRGQGDRLGSGRRSSECRGRSHSHHPSSRPGDTDNVNHGHRMGSTTRPSPYPASSSISRRHSDPQYENAARSGESTFDPSCCRRWIGSQDAYNRGILTEEERPEERTDWEKDIGMRHRNALRTTPDILKLAPSDELPGGPTPRKEWQTVEHSESQISNIGQIAM